ncbi:LysE family translocator [Desulfovibrio cuneatus]|uniref:LysE family translocator n=1 Tax=Desulfovibrio cuneatus TaxID=159728 RepID=UPI0003F4EB44|nr:LysE family transporter [Desulfovibrio cuneatus]
MTQWLHTFMAPAFPALALAHFLALLSPGPDFFLIVGHAVRNRLPGALLICLGIALGNALYIVLAIAGWSAIKEHPAIYLGFELAGVVYLLWVGGRLLRAAKAPFNLQTESARALPPLPQLGLGLASALLNPKNAVFYLSLMAVIMGPETTITQHVFAGVWMATVVFVWDAGVAACIALPRVQRLVCRFIPAIEGLAGLMLLAIALALLWRRVG